MLDKIYSLSPYFFKVLMLNTKAFLNKRKRYTTSYKGYLREYITLWTADKTEINNYQKEKLSELLTEAFDFVPYYQANFEKLSIVKEDIIKDPFTVLKSLPLLSKEDRKKEVSSLINTNPARPQIEVGYTSGTSGSPTVNYLDAESIERAFALWSRFHHTIGISPKHKAVRFSGRILINPNKERPPFWVENYIEKQLFMSSYHLKKDNAVHYVDQLNKFAPEFMDGYPSAFYILARFINSNQYKLTFTPIAIATTAETLHDYQRVEIEKAFNCGVFNQYASSEGSPFITECKSGNLHINEDSGVFEFLKKDDTPASHNEIGRLVVTSFRNYKTPLIRYDILDAVLLPKDDIACNCGCNMPIVEKIIGREDDLLWTEEKGFIGRMDTAYKGLEGITKSQIIQESLNKFVIKNVVDTDYSPEMEKKFIKNLNERLGYSITIQMKYVDDIPLGANGKFNAVVRNCTIPNS